MEDLFFKPKKITLKKQCYIVGDIGKILIAYKKNKDPECRKIKLPIKNFRVQIGFKKNKTL